MFPKGSIVERRGLPITHDLIVCVMLSVWHHPLFTTKCLGNLLQIMAEELTPKRARAQ